MGAEAAGGWSGGLLPITIWAGAVFAVLWLILSWLEARERRAYNLTRADIDGKGADPGFLKVDHEKRAAAIEAGKVFDEKIAARDAGEAASPMVEKAKAALPWMQTLTVAFGIVSIALAGLSAFARVETLDATVRQLTSVEAFVAIIQQYWVGFLIVIATILVQIFKFYQSQKSS